MNLEDIWLRISEGEGHSSVPDLLVRRIDPESPDDLFVGLRTSARTKFLLLRMPSEPRLSRNALVQSRGFRTTLVRFDGDPSGSANLMIESSNASFNDLFEILSKEIVENIANRGTGEASLSVFIACLQRWKLFFDTTGVEGLADETLFGLLAELVFLKDFVLPHIPYALGGVSAWFGPDKLSKDFQFSTCSVEVKCSSMREHTKVYISGERQLDGRELPALFLFILKVERVGASGSCVPDLVDDIRRQLGNCPARVAFEEKLISYGYHDTHRSKYTEKRFLIHGHRIYQITDLFPRLIAPLPIGVGDLSYTVALSACNQFAKDDSEVIRLISESALSYDA